MCASAHTKSEPAEGWQLAGCAKTNRPGFIAEKQSRFPSTDLLKFNQLEINMPSATSEPVSRRRFIAIIPALGVGVLSACTPKAEVPPTPAPMQTTPPADPVPAPAPTLVLPMLDEKDPQAIALGYVEDSTKADKSKFPVSVVGSICGNCALYTGKSGDASGPCTVFPGKNVMAAGWCNSWAKKT
jgi:hypothetical protein